VPKAVKRYVRKACLKKTELKRVSVFQQDVELYSKGGAAHDAELSQLIIPGLDDTNRVGRIVDLQGLKFKYVMNAVPGGGPILVRWIIVQHIGKNYTADPPLLNADRVEKTYTDLEGVESIFSVVNRKSWRVLMAGNEKFLNESSEKYGDTTSGVYNLHRDSTGVITRYKTRFRKLRQKLTYESTPRKVDANGKDYWDPVMSNSPIYLAVWARCMDNEEVTTHVRAVLHYQLTLMFRDP
jgi:hypothetical protein